MESDYLGNFVSSYESYINCLKLTKKHVKIESISSSTKHLVRAMISRTFLLFYLYIMTQINALLQVLDVFSS